MNGPEHVREAERLLADAATGADTGPVYFMDDALPALAAAQVHATLALTAATASLLMLDTETPWKEALQ